MSKSTVYIKKLVLIALLGGSLNVAKFLFMYIPNVEVVSLLIVVYTYSFGLSVGFPATLVFCCIEGLIFGFNPTWVVSYFVHWPFLSLVTYGCRLMKIKHSFPIALVVGAVTAMFGVQSTFFYYLLGGAIGKPQWVEKMLATYISGWLFYLVQTVVNIVLVTVCFRPLTSLLTRLGDKYFLKG